MTKKFSKTAVMLAVVGLIAAAMASFAGAGTADSFYLLDMVSSKVMDNLCKGIQEMIQGKVTPQQVLDNVQTIWEEELTQK